MGGGKRGGGKGRERGEGEREEGRGRERGKRGRKIWVKMVAQCDV